MSKMEELVGTGMSEAEELVGTGMSEMVLQWQSRVEQGRLEWV